MSHLYFGFTIGDWVGIITIIGAVLGGLGVLTHWLIGYAETTLIQPLKYELRQATQSIGKLTEASEIKHVGFENRLDEHDRRLDRHSLRLKNVEKEVFKHED
jgi:hypothetical protein